MGDGFSVEPEALTAATRQLRDASATLSGSTGAPPPTPDAGASSAVVGAALARVQQLGVLVSAVMDQIAGEVDATRGSYADIDNTAAGSLRWADRPDDHHPLTTFVQGNSLLLTEPPPPPVVDNGTYIGGYRASGPR